ncbi:PREDICTED: disease resistance protein RPM1-like [Prunus mume]|uniref:Disease resistance protein RPM1-like n=1 Tax=Prunus mume TaxID=102107 RepID=A0ABM0P7X7_PRUMU|nr:PREDICTED: disease resistance protein RPM1-like [Prunus mume]
MASAATDLFLGKFVAILESEAASIAGVRDQVDEIKQELVFMKSFLEDADGGEQAHTQVEKAWVASVRDLANDVENTIDEFMYHVYEQRNGRRFARWIHKTIHFPKHLWYKRRIANKLQKITMAIRAIPERNQRYRGAAAVEVKSTSEDIRRWVQNQAESSLYHQEDELVGIEGDKNMLLRWLMDEAKHQTVVSVVGMGGSGKTTLVARTFKDDIVKRHFECYAWITVSQSYVIEDLLRRLIKEFHKEKKEEVPAEMNAMSYNELLEILVNYLETKRYLVVLDDVWDVHLWEKLRFSFPDKQLGSRVMLTTRREDIASSSFGVESHVHKIQPLEMGDAWELFSMKAFSSYQNKSCSPELLPLARELVEKCEGLPLAIVALSGLMSSKKSLTEWSTVYNSLNWHLTNNSLLEPMKMRILLFSFNDLPYRLKQCFLYCSLFPEDYVIINNRLIRLWIAEGFVEHVEGLTPEEVANSYLMELIFRNMLQQRFRGSLPSCKMHDLLREIALSIAKKEKFGDVHEGSETVEETGALRLSIQTTNEEIGAGRGMSRLHSFLVFATVVSSFSFSNKLPFDLKLLKVLDLEDVPIDNLPDRVTCLFNLKYLSLLGTLIKELPESIGQLRNLQTLNIMETKIEALPRGISKLLNLRHLLVGRFISRKMIGVRIPSSIGKMKKLQSLAYIESEGRVIRLIGSMTQLTFLGITNVKERDEEDLCALIQEMKVLSRLFLFAADGEEFLRVDALSSPPPYLDILYLSGKLEKVPHWFCSLHSLTYLDLRESRLEEDLLPHIEALPSLHTLWLVNASVRKELCFNRGFVKLRQLRFLSLALLNKITIEKGAMPNLEFLGIRRCLTLETLPQGIEHLTKLQGYRFDNVSEKFRESIKEGGVDHARMQLVDERCKKYADKSWD